MTPDSDDRGRNLLLIIGATIMIFGVWALLGQMGILPYWLTQNWQQLRGGIVLIAIGGLIIWASRGGFRAPTPGATLYRAREDKWVAGVIGGLGRYFNLEPTLLRLAFIALVLFGEGWPVIGYIVLALFVPKEPVGFVPPVVVQPPAPAPAPVAAPTTVPTAPAAPEAPPAPKTPRRKKA
jgi:phage shock protein PspC (stress-responsive transcriptional regulator)